MQLPRNVEGSLPIISEQWRYRNRNMLDTDEFKTRLKLFMQSNNLIETWERILDEITKSTYPWVNLLQNKLLKCAIDVIWTTEFSNADYNEVLYRLLHFEKSLFPSEAVVIDTVNELCERGALECRTSEFRTYDM